MSGGTAASASATLGAASRDPALIRLLTDAFALTPDSRPVAAVGPHPRYDPGMNALLVPFAMAPVNTKTCAARFRVGTSLRHRFRLRRDDGRAGSRRNGSRGVGDARHGVPCSGPAVSNPAQARPGKSARRFATISSSSANCRMADGSRRSSAGEPRSRLWLDQQDDRRKRTLPRRDVQGEGGSWTPGALMGRRPQAFDRARRPRLRRALETNESAGLGERADTKWSCSYRPAGRALRWSRHGRSRPFTPWPGRYPDGR